ncbi:MAG TPA: lamin tail domain-containing protein, partial [Candidatus Saccharimonadales bacterium]|nr:lamin tail domain-containing protein [Candidatus Saccharimonadales bacterium]
MNLQNWCLTDDPLHLALWRFPATNLPAGGFLLVFASGKNRTVAGAPLHTNFRLDQDGEYLALLQPDGVTVDNAFAPAFPPQRANVSYGVGEREEFFVLPTPGAANGPGVLGFVADTKVSTNRGFFFAPVDVTLRCSTPGATLVYTTNGDEPTLATGVRVPPLNATSPPLAVVHLEATTALRLAAFKDGFVSSGVDTHTYIFPTSVVNQVRPPGASAIWVDDPPGSGQYPADFTVDPNVVNNTRPGYSFTNALLALPTVSLVMPGDGLFGAAQGIYTHAFNMGTNWERRTSAELIYPDGREGFHLTAGARMHGAVSRLNAVISKHPMRLLFQDEYGPGKLHFALFPGSPVQEFDHVVLRACSTDAWPIADTLDFLWRSGDATYLRDQWMRDAQLAMGHVSARGIYVHLYLNGLYWGVYDLTERLSDSFFAEHLGGAKEDWDVVTDFDGQAVAGTRDTWTQLLVLSGRAASDPTVLNQIQGLNPDGSRNPNFPVLINLDNFIDYMALHIYAAAIDWPGRNWWAARRRGPESDGFHFFVWDQEIALDRLDRVGTWGNSPANIEAVNEPNTPGQVYDGLRRDPEFRLRFADRLQKHLFNGGALTLESNVVRWAARAAEIDRAIVGESARWGDAHHAPAYTRQDDWLRTSNFVQNIYWTGNLPRAWTRFRNVGLYPDVSAPGFGQFGGDVPAGFQLALSHTNATGTIFFTVDHSDPRLRGGGLAPTAQIFTEPITILAPTLIRARVRVGATWSALVEATFYPPQDLRGLQLSEIMYNPPKFGAVDGEEVEFLELWNSSDSPLDLSGLAFTTGISFTFTNGTRLGPGAYFVLGRNAVQFSARYPGAPLNGLYTGKLDNQGETLRLSGPTGATLFFVT